MPKMSRLLAQLGRQKVRQERLAEQQRQIMTFGTARLNQIDDQIAAIQANTGRIEVLEQKVAELDEDLSKHWDDNKRHTGKAP